MTPAEPRQAGTARGYDPLEDREAMGEARTQAARCRQILDAARTCFGRHGFHGASMARIADEARISVGHIYRYFESKEAVVAAIAEEDLALAVEDLSAINAEPDRFPSRLLEGFLACYTEAKMALWLEILSEAARNPKIAAIMREKEARIRAQMRQALLRSCGDCPQPDSEAMNVRIETVFAVLEGVNLRRFKQGGEMNPALLSEIEAMLSVALSAPLRAPARSEPKEREGERHARVDHLPRADEYGRHHRNEA